MEINPHAMAIPRAYVRTIALGSLTGNFVDAFLGRFRIHGHTERGV
jgi:hypothetical protein